MGKYKEIQNNNKEKLEEFLNSILSDGSLIHCLDEFEVSITMFGSIKIFKVSIDNDVKYLDKLLYQILNKSNKSRFYDGDKTFSFNEFNGINWGVYFVFPNSKMASDYQTKIRILKSQ